MPRSKTDDGQNIVPTHSQLVVEVGVQMSVSHSGTHRVRVLLRKGQSVQLVGDRSVSGRPWSVHEWNDICATLVSYLTNNLYATEGCQLSLLRP